MMGQVTAPGKGKGQASLGHQLGKEIISLPGKPFIPCGNSSDVLREWWTTRTKGGVQIDGLKQHYQSLIHCEAREISRGKPNRPGRCRNVEKQAGLVSPVVEVIRGSYIDSVNPHNSSSKHWHWHWQRPICQEPPVYHHQINVRVRTARSRGCAKSGRSPHRTSITIHAVRAHLHPQTEGRHPLWRAGTLTWLNIYLLPQVINTG